MEKGFVHGVLVLIKKTFSEAVIFLSGSRGAGRGEMFHDTSSAGILQYYGIGMQFPAIIFCRAPKSTSPPDPAKPPPPKNVALAPNK
jgi:hypothetical protein